METLKGKTYHRISVSMLVCWLISGAPTLVIWHHSLSYHNSKHRNCTDTENKHKLKCDKCRQYTCFLCTDLPTYMLISTGAVVKNLASNVNLSYYMGLWTLGSKLQKNNCWTFFQ